MWSCVCQSGIDSAETYQLVTLEAKVRLEKQFPLTPPKMVVESPWRIVDLNNAMAEPVSFELAVPKALNVIKTGKIVARKMPE